MCGWVESWWKLEGLPLRLGNGLSSSPILHSDWLPSYYIGILHDGNLENEAENMESYQYSAGYVSTVN